MKACGLKLNLLKNFVSLLIKNIFLEILACRFGKDLFTIFFLQKIELYAAVQASFHVWECFG